MNIKDILESELNEGFKFDKKKIEDNRNNSLIENELKDIINKINDRFLKSYSFKNHILRLNFGKTSSLYDSWDMKHQSQIIKKIRDELKKRKISMSRNNDYFILKFDNKPEKEYLDIDMKQFNENLYFRY